MAVRGLSRLAFCSAPAERRRAIDGKHVYRWTPKRGDRNLFGAQKSALHADAKFLERALATAPVTYTFHKAETEAFVRQRVAELGGEATHRKAYAFPLPHSMPFHTDAVREVPVVMLRVLRKPS